jgi:hypothetical protein
MKAHAIAQVKYQGERIAQFPTLRQRGREVKTCVLLNQSIEKQFVNVLRLAIGAHAGIEICGTTLNQKHDGAGIPLRRFAAEEENKSREKEKITHT